MPDLDILVLARNSTAYHRWCKEQDVRPWGEGYRFASGAHALDGRAFDGVVIVDSTFWRRADAVDLYSAALATTRLGLT